jgi:hypothetical protein
MRLSGEAYYLSVISDLAIEPPGLPKDIAPANWKNRFDEVQEWIESKRLGLLVSYPAVLEGARRAQQPSLAEFEAGNFTGAISARRELAEHPSVENLLVVTPLIEAFGFPEEAKADVMKVLGVMRGQWADGEERRNVVALSVLAHIAVSQRRRACRQGRRRLHGQGAVTHRPKSYY